MKSTESNSSTLEETNRVKLRTALHDFYRKHNTSMVSYVDKVVSDHEGNVPDLNQKLRAKYAADLSDIGFFCSLSGNHKASLKHCKHNWFFTFSCRFAFRIVGS
jgi:hypothetical protein